MLQQPEYTWPGSNEELARLVADHPWVTMVSSTSRGLVVTHLPVVPDPGADPDGEPVLLGHLPLRDAEEHELGRAETVLVVQGPHGYVSAAWYVGGPYVSTWNYVVAHLHGIGERLDPAGTLEVLRLTQDHFESQRSRPFDLGTVADYVDRLAPHVVGFRLSPTRVVAKAKLSQDKPVEDVVSVLAALEDPAEPFAHPGLAATMRLAADHRPPAGRSEEDANWSRVEPDPASGQRAAGSSRRPLDRPRGALQLDLVLENADVVTMDPTRPRATRIGVLDGRVVGLDEDLDGWSARERHDLGGACVLPGFIDAHTHLELTGQNLAAVDIAGCATTEAALAVIAEASRGIAAEDWLEVSGYDQGVLGRHLTAQELDVASGGRKVWVRQISCHASVVSTAVLDRLGEDLLATPDAAAGLFRELDQNAVLDKRMPYAVDEIANLIRAAAGQARSQGITMCVDAGNGGEVGALSAVDGAAYLQLLESQQLPIRMQLMPSIDVLRDMRTHASDGFRRSLDLGLRSGFGSDWLGIAAQKVVLDGGMQVETARMTVPYEGTDNIGVWRQDPGFMVEATVDGHCAGWQMALHAIGDAAIDLAIEAFEKAQARMPRADARHRIEHGGVIRDDQLERIARLGVTVVSQPSFIHDFGDRYADQLGPERTSWLYRGRSLLDAGIRLVGSTDRPLPGDPLRAIQTLVERTSSTGQVLCPREQIGVQAALSAFTVDAAWLLRREDRLGRVAPHFLADLTVLAHNPLTIDRSGIADIAVLGTVVDGRTWWA